MKAFRSSFACARPTRSGTGGFTLVELMIVVAIVAILASIAYPSYQQHVMKSRRATAQSCLLEVSQFMERFYATNMRYDKTADGKAVTFPNTQCTTDLAGQYVLRFAAGEPTAGSYTIEAVPQGHQATLDTKCGTLSFNHRGEKKVSVTGTPVSDCWK